MEINKDLLIGNTNYTLGQLIPENMQSGKPWKIGTYKANGRIYPIYRVYLDLGSLPNASTKTYSFDLPDFYGILDASFIAFSGNSRISLPYVYPNLNYVNYWITLEAFNSNSVSVITGTDRRGYNLWGVFEYVAYK